MNPILFNIPYYRLTISENIMIIWDFIEINEDFNYMWVVGLYSIKDRKVINSHICDKFINCTGLQLKYDDESKTISFETEDNDPKINAILLS